MNVFRVSVVASNPKSPGQRTDALEALVDTDAELTWLPAELLWAIGVTPRRMETFSLVGNLTVERGVAYVMLRANGRETPCEVVFAEPGDRLRVGVRALQGFGIKMENPQHRFIDLATMAAFKAGQKSVVKFSLKI
jgi:predicted aspartyl protease